MLTRLHIRDFALIQAAAIEFGAGFNVITGETGAGKSILMGALYSILGGPAGGSPRATWRTFAKLSRPARTRAAPRPT
jgi:DNA repair ATPase RecN